MPFLFEESSSHQWSSLQAEHDLLENWIKQPLHSGFVGYLNHRVADRDRRIALYYVEGIGMGDGQRFAMVYESLIVWFDVLKVWGKADFKSTPLRISSVDIPEALNNQRDTIKALLAEALTVYYQTSPFTYFSPTQLLLSYQDTDWKVLPRKYSWLFWKIASMSTWSKYKFKLRNVPGYATCPLLLALLLALLGYLSLMGEQVPIWVLLLVGGWLVHRIDRYDNDYRFWYWLIGVSKSKSQFPMLAFSLITERLMNPVPLDLLTVQLRLGSVTDRHIGSIL